MGYIKKFVNYIGKINLRNNKDCDTKVDLDESDELECKFAATVISADKETMVNFKDLFTYIEEKEFKYMLKMAQERDDVKSKYIFGEVKDLF